MSNYHNENLCIECAGNNDIEETNHIEQSGSVVMCECVTTCTVCGHVDIWAYGFFQSTSEDNTDD